MKKTVALLLTLLLLFSLAACAGKGGDDGDAPGITEGAKVDVGESALYTEEERLAAAEAVKAKFAELNGCKLNSLTFSGDERCEKELESLKTRDDVKDATACIVFDSSFRSPKNGGGAWEANEVYTWSWMVARTAAGAWEVVNYGYA